MTKDTKSNPVVIIQTGLGNIEVELYPDKAPITVANFLTYVDSVMYEGGRFHRTVTMDNQPNDDVKIEVIQGGRAQGSGRGFPAIKLERTNLNGILHKDGVISMARGGPDSATSDFFICVGDQPSLDFGGARNTDGQGFAAFGKVIYGMDVVRKIHVQPTGSARGGQSLNPPIKIINITRK
ncbi:peptidylprolyl isomerase [bacterium SM23_31]|nr:MAG: peptidylprolyl isomerase [bacterium SM23_31]